MALTLSFAVSGVVIAAPPPAAPEGAAGTPAAAQPQDDSLFEFLGSDDIEDARLWDYLLKKSQRAPPPPQPAPVQEAGR